MPKGSEDLDLNVIGKNLGTYANDWINDARKGRSLKQCCIDNPIVTTIASVALIIIGLISLAVFTPSTIIAFKNKSVFHLVLSIVSAVPLLITIFLLLAIAISILCGVKNFKKNLQSQIAFSTDKRGAQKSKALRQGQKMVGRAQSTFNFLKKFTQPAD